jgi:hypothetical protein
MIEEAPVFVALFDGGPPRQFLTLQDAMFWTEGLDNPTGTIEFEGQAIIAYVNGSIEAVE